MAGTASPGAPGPSVAPPPLPSGWIAQWDESTRKYYYVELGTGRSQWDVPTQPAPTAISTPANSSINHPYGIPPSGASPAQQPRIITHADGSQTMQHADGRMEPILPPGTAGAPEGTRGMDGPSGDRGFGTFAQNALNSFAGKQGGGGGGGVGNFGGKVVSGLASSLFSSGGDKPQPQNYHGAPQTGPHSSGGLAGAVMGGVATMFGGSQGKPSGNFGYSNAGPASYSGTAPPTSYQPPSQPGTSPTAHSAPTPHSQPSPSYHQPQQSPSYQQPQQSPSFQQPQQSPSFQQLQHPPAYQQPPHQQPPAPYGGYPQRSAYGGQPQYEHHQPQPPYGGQHQYPHQPAYPGHPPPPSQPGYQGHHRY